MLSVAPAFLSMATNFDIISQALILIGEAPISSFSEGTAGLVADQMYTITLDGLLTSHRWRFATGKQALNRLTDSPLNDYKYAFQLPSQMLMLINAQHNPRYEIYEDKLYTEMSSISIDYIFRPAESKFPQYFIEALAARLAETFALSITNNQKMREAMGELAGRRFQESIFKDSQGRPPTAIQHRPFVDIRR